MPANIKILLLTLCSLALLSCYSDGRYSISGRYQHGRGDYYLRYYDWPYYVPYSYRYYRYPPYKYRYPYRRYYRDRPHFRKPRRYYHRRPYQRYPYGPRPYFRYRR